MGNYLKMADKQKILALLELGWSYRRIQRETGIDRETVARLDPRRQSKSAKVPIGPGANAARVPTGSTSACEPYRTIIEAAVARGLSASRKASLEDSLNLSHGSCLSITPSRQTQVEVAYLAGRPRQRTALGRWQR